MTHPWTRLPFKIGSHLTANEDRRHVARVDSYPWGPFTIRVTWIDTGWRSDLHVKDDQVEQAEPRSKQR
jgi:hypothetical protein